MKSISLVVPIIAILLLSGCKDTSPISTWEGHMMWTAEKGDKVIHYFNNLIYWSDESDIPTLAVASVLQGEVVKSLQIESKTEMGKIVSVKITNSPDAKELPLYNKELIDKEMLPVYYSTDGITVKVVNMSFDRFDKFKKTISEENQEALLEYFQ